MGDYLIVNRDLPAGICEVDHSGVGKIEGERYQAGSGEVGMEHIEVREDASRPSGALVRIGGYDYPATLMPPF